MGRSRYKIIHIDQPHFLTLSILHWIPVFTRPETVNHLLNSFTHLIDRGLKLYAYVILENHLHLIAQSPQLNKDMTNFKSYTARRIIDHLKHEKVTTILDQLAFYKKPHKTDRSYQLWQEGMHPQLISSESMLKQKINYIHHNPVKRGYVDHAEHWRYSSARDYLGQAGLIDIHKNWL